VAHSRVYVQAGCGPVLVVLVLATLALDIGSSGAATPLPYVPVANPLELASWLVLLLVLRWLVTLGTHDARLAPLAEGRGAVAAFGAWFLVTVTVGRAVHHWSGVPYTLDDLVDSTTFQSALSIVWGSAGLAAMVAGARASRRHVWLAGAVLMAVVVAKLFLVDLGNTATLARVVSFLGVGVLLLVVGYFAPVPPRVELTARTANQ
jgi:uncharacterized membrane protein